MSSGDDKTLREKSEEIDERFDEIRTRLEEGDISQRAAARHLQRLHSDIEATRENYEQARQDADRAVSAAHSRMNRTMRQQEEIEDLLDDIKGSGPTGGGKSRTRRKFLGGLAGAIAVGVGADWTNLWVGDGSCDYSDRASPDIDYFGNRWPQRYCSEVERTPSADGDDWDGGQATDDDDGTPTPWDGGTATDDDSGDTPTETPYAGIHTNTEYSFEDIQSCLTDDQIRTIDREVAPDNESPGDYSPADFQYEIHLETGDGETGDYKVNIFYDDDLEAILGDQRLNCEVKRSEN